MYLRILFTVIGLLFTIIVIAVIDFSKRYPLPVTNRISFDAKLKFIRENINPDKVDTLIVGSSIGLNNILGDVLEKSSTNIDNALNLSVYEATTLQVEQVLELSDAFPNLERIIYSAQYSDFPHARRYKNYNSALLVRFIRHELSPLALLKVYFKGCNNLIFCYERASQWEKKHMQKNKFTYLGFDHTGSVPLEIYTEKGVGGRWWLPHPGIMHEESFAAVGRMAEKALQNNIKFYMIHSPYREPLVKKHKGVRDALSYFEARLQPIIEQYSATLVRLQKLHLDDRYFADRSHLNLKGSRRISIKIGMMVDENEK